MHIKRSELNVVCVRVHKLVDLSIHVLCEVLLKNL